ncbi:hypothetical protein Barb4_00616 [Bacteroidales bacterium Barb4]|nr:hypothetical protein Barb4_00616 [Bacteroidales bacterium Barb4]
MTKILTESCYYSHLLNSLLPNSPLHDNYPLFCHAMIVNMELQVKKRSNFFLGSIKKPF